jgi:hypothetical protein
MRCPDDIELQSFFDGELFLKRTYQIEKHVSQCLACQQKVAGLDEVVLLLKKGLPDVAVPRLSTYQAENTFMKKLACVAAVIIIIGTVSGSLFYHANRRVEWNPEMEIMDQYITLYIETSSVIAE